MEAACNIEAAGQRQRQVFGLVMLVVGIGLAGWLVLTHVERPWRLGVFVPFVLGGIGVFQARAKTCVAHAARGVREVNGRLEPITDEGERRAIDDQARAVKLQAIGLASVLTAITVALP
jgi:hypothetical protein